MAEETEERDRAWRRRLFEFALEHRRTCTLREWRLMRHAFEVERWKAEKPTLLMAADGETLDAVLAELSARTWTANFRAEDDACRLNVTFRPQADGAPSVYVKICNAEGSPLPGARMAFPDGDGVAVDARGRARIGYDEYLGHVRRALSVSVVTPDGRAHALELD